MFWHSSLSFPDDDPELSYIFSLPWLPVAVSSTSLLPVGWRNFAVFPTLSLLWLCCVLPLWLLFVGSSHQVLGGTTWICPHYQHLSGSFISGSGPGPVFVVLGSPSPAPWAFPRMIYSVVRLLPWIASNRSTSPLCHGDQAWTANSRCGLKYCLKILAELFCPCSWMLRLDPEQPNSYIPPVVYLVLCQSWSWSSKKHSGVTGSQHCLNLLHFYCLKIRYFYVL